MGLPTRKLGSLEVTAVGLGCMNLSHGYGLQVSEDASVALLNRAIDMGCTLFDTAALYGYGENERLVGRAIGHRRSEFKIASKCVLMVGEDGSRTLNGRPEAIGRTLDKSLKSLKTDHIDLYQLHRLDPDVPIEESVGALSRAVDAGKIGHIGLSEMSADTIRRAHREHAICSVQSEYSPIVRNPEIAVLDTCRELGIGFLAFSPVGRGMLADRIAEPVEDPADMRTTFPRFTEPHFSRNRPMVERYNALARDLEITPAQLSLAWLLARGGNVVPIPGTTDIRHLEENLEAASVRLSDEAIAKVEDICGRENISGARYSASAQATVGTETFVDEELA